MAAQGLSLWNVPGTNFSTESASVSFLFQKVILL